MPLRLEEQIRCIEDALADRSIKVYNVGSGVGPSGSLHNMEEVTLNLPGRDQKIEEYKNYLRYLGKAGIHYTTYAHMGNGIWSSGPRQDPRLRHAGVRHAHNPDAATAAFDVFVQVWEGQWLEASLPSVSG